MQAAGTVSLKLGHEHSVHEGAGEEREQEQWSTQGKHFIVLTSAGKPIYSRHGDEDTLAG